MEVVKAISTPRYEVKLIQSKAGLYYVTTLTTEDDEPVYSEAMRDFSVASTVFDKRLMDLEGN